ncbi:MAG TPA: nucleoside hydrolase [Terriglobia bacterium]|nr:nucleoside hydrolase [Terriglobia bacterium]
MSPKLITLFSSQWVRRHSYLLAALITCCVVALPGLHLFAQRVARGAAPIPILLDTDIGTDIDDAFALALILRSPELRLLGVTTVSGDTAARARLAAKMLREAGKPRIPVAAGKPGKPLPIEQTRWAENFTSPQLLRETAVDFLDAQFSKYPGKITLVAIGPLTNLGMLLQKDPSVARKIKRIVMMGGSIARGYDDHTTPDPEYNIVMDIPAARVVFASGIPILMAPLDVTAMLQLSARDRQRIFNQGTPLAQSLAALYRLWGHPTPILFDPMAVALLIRPHLCETQPLAIRVDAKGYTRVESGGKPNATVALHTDPQKFFDFYLSRVAPTVQSGLRFMPSNSSLLNTGE